MRILLATDGSEHARLAETLLGRLPLTRAAHVVAVTVTASASTTTALMQAWASFDFAQESLACTEAMRAHAERASSEAVERLCALGISAEGRVLEGDPSFEVVKLAKQEGFDLVACGSRSQSPLQAFFLGSVARKLVSHSPCSLVVAHPFEGRTPEESAALLESRDKLTALVAVDGSPGAAAAVAFLQRLDGGVFGRIIALAVEPLAIMPLLTDYPLAVPEAGDSAQARQFAEDAAGSLAGYAGSVEAVFMRERPATGILAKAAAMGADLIVIGATHHTGVERMLIGSVSYEVAVSARRPVLVVRD
jgi:nucleotide-binding universal stress UspA family protein